MYTAVFFDKDHVNHGSLPILGGRFVFRNCDVSNILLHINGNAEKWLDGRFDLPGGHILVEDDGEQIFAGLVTGVKDEYSQGTRDIQVTAECHLIYTQQMITLPSPSRAPDKQDVEAYYKAKGNAGDLIFNLVRTHVAQGAKEWNRTPLRVNSSQVTAGSEVSINSRFKPLLEELQKLADAGNVVFDTYLSEEGIPRFEVHDPIDRSRTVLFRESNASLTEYALDRNAPTASRILVAGQGEGEERTLRLVEVDQTEWENKGLVFRDRRDTDEGDELQQAGEETLEEHAEKANLTFTAEKIVGLRYGVDYLVGDIVSVELENFTEPVIDTLQSCTIDWDGESEEYSITVGPERGDPSEQYLLRVVKRLYSQIRNLEAR